MSLGSEDFIIHNMNGDRMQGRLFVQNTYLADNGVSFNRWRYELISDKGERFNPGVYFVEIDDQVLVFSVR